ncbi:MAG: type II toxin-antitoxin system VapC family toxin [Rhizobiaceae bacterium]|jgi:ribonuclease VapC
MFVDSSVVVAILSDEDDAEEWLERLRTAETKATSAVVMLESVMRLSSKLRIEPLRIESVVLRFFERFGIVISPIGAAECRLAIQAFSLYGKGRGHPAQLNLADCLSYACARNLNIPLLYKGNDFARTDMA